VGLPFLLTGILLLAHRGSRYLGRARAAEPESKQLLLLSFIAILSHPILDALNTYGMRWLMPFSGTWFYGDTLFIVDPWVWLALAAGIYFSRRSAGAARLALAAVMLYIGTMALSGRAARSIITREIASLSGRPVDAVMAGPVPFDPLVRDFVAEQGDEYQVGTFRWLAEPQVRNGEVKRYPRSWPSHPAFEAAAKTLPARRFLGWARFPTFEVDTVRPGEYLVHLVDLRYARGPGGSFGALSIPVRLKTTSAPSP
jgi:inner membrane protein